jgi:hypothetical protein
MIESLHGLGLPALALGLEGSTDHLARTLEAGANDAISLKMPVSQLVGKAKQLAS